MSSIWVRNKQTADNISYHLHGSIDAIYLLKSIFDYGCATVAANPAVASMDVSKIINVHLWPVFIVAAVAVGAFGWLAHYQLTKDERARKCWLIQKCCSAYPHVRNFLSDLKNPRHMVVNWYFVIHGFAHVSAYSVFNPIGIALGIIVALSMISYRRMANRRERYKKENFNLAKTILAEHEIENPDQLEQQIKRMKLHESVGGYVAACINGVVDGAYILGCFFAVMTFGLGGLTGGAPLIAAVIFVAIFTVLFAANHLCKEYEEQKKHKLSIKECEFAIRIKKSLIMMPPETEELKTLTQQLDPMQKKIDFINKTNNRYLAKLFATDKSLLAEYSRLTAQYNEVFKEAFESEFNTHYQKALQDYLNRPSCLDKIFKPFCDTKRTIISCMKNSKAAIEYGLLALGCSIKSVNTLILTVVIGVVYSAYLAINRFYKKHISCIRKKNKSVAITKELNIKLSENTMGMLNSKRFKRSESYSPPSNSTHAICRQSSCSF